MTLSKWCCYTILVSPLLCSFGPSQYRGTPQAAMLEDKPLKFAIWLHCTDWPGYPGQSYAPCAGISIEGSHKQPCWRTNHLSLPFDCIAQTDLDIQVSHMHHVLAPYRGFSQAAMLEDKPLKFAIWLQLHTLTWISRSVMCTRNHHVLEPGH